MRLLDTDILSDIQHGHPPVVAWVATLTEMPSISDIGVMELIQKAYHPQQLRQALKQIAPLPNP
jgi:hypothetical protein